MARSAAAQATLLAIREARATRNRAEADEFRLLAEFGEQNSTPPTDPDVVLDGMERMVDWGGDGTPAVSEFCSMEVALMLRLTDESARCLIGHALGAKHRLPRLWKTTMAGDLRVWHAREVVTLTHRLTREQADILDAEVSGLWSTMAWRRLREFIKGRVLDLLDEVADTDRERALRNTNVTIHESWEGVASFSGSMSAADAVVLDGTLDRLVEVVRSGGAKGDHQNLRAVALGLLATPARALQLLQASLVDQLPQDFDPDNPTDCGRAGQYGHECGRVTVDPDKLLPKATLVLHLSDLTAGRGKGVVRGEQVGPVLARWVKDLVGHHRVSVRPVIDPADGVPVDSYEVPARMRQAVTLRNPYEVFPWSSKRSAGLDLDHTIPWEPTRGDPLTRADNLGPLSRKVHRAKTFGGWKLHQPAPGVFVWTTPLGFSWLQTPSQSWLVA
ncbi:DUF222 domain-containing protein [Propionibacteriaceae bacterium Y1923]|uniref:HNH endonuclease signature motif containing protein n=1 Tax=Aestuariimicrobium sp. Y1814 TaxID=3418742 RepID=UPI003C254F9C